MLTAATYPVPFSLALQDPELQNQERSAKSRSGGRELEARLVAVGAARVGRCAHGSAL